MRLTAGRSRVTLSETVSETPGGKMGDDEDRDLGGRPPAFPTEYLEMIREMHPRVTTRRGLLNIAYRVEALDVATPEELEALREGREWPLPPTVLTELGRFLAASWPLETVRYLWECVDRANPTARDACEALRDLRNSEAEPETAIAIFLSELESVAGDELDEEWWAFEPQEPQGGTDE